MKDVLISIKGIQDTGITPDPENDAVELVTRGTYQHSEAETIFSYMESEMTGMEGTRTTFRITPDIVTLLREGTTNSQMVFQPGKKHVMLYNTEHGSLSFGVSTKRLTSGMDYSGGDMRIDYILDMDSVVVSKNSFVINVRELKGSAGVVLPQ